MTYYLHIALFEESSSTVIDPLAYKDRSDIPRLVITAGLPDHEHVRRKKAFPVNSLTDVDVPLIA